MARLPPIVAFAAPSGTGKTTLIEAVVRALVDRGLRVGVLKSDAHRVVLDTPGKDSWRFAEAGARAVAVLSTERSALFERLDGDVSLVAAIERFFPTADIVLAEGFRRSGLPTIRVHRSGGPDSTSWDPPRHVIAWASDTPRSESVPVLPLDEPERIAEWLVQRFISIGKPRQVTVVCPARTPEEAQRAVAAARRIGRVLAARPVVVAACELPLAGVDGVSMIRDIRPQIGLLGALFTGLASADTPDVLFVGPRHWQAPGALLVGLVAAGPPLADIVYPRVDGHAEPALALYGHRCLSNIQAALLSGELRLTGWWGQVRTFAVESSCWRGWDPRRRSFPRSFPLLPDGNVWASDVTDRCRPGTSPLPKPDGRRPE